jgi:hypothetical protein
MAHDGGRFQQIERRARAAILLGAGFILGFTFLVLSFTVWREPDPSAHEPVLHQDSAGAVGHPPR